MTKIVQNGTSKGKKGTNLLLCKTLRIPSLVFSHALFFPPPPLVGGGGGGYWSKHLPL